jgi:hypothetical protein
MLTSIFNELLPLGILFTQSDGTGGSPMCYPPGANNGSLAIPEDSHRNEVAGKWLLFVGERFLFRPINCVVERCTSIIGWHCGATVDAPDQGCKADNTLKRSSGFHIFR